MPNSDRTIKQTLEAIWDVSGVKPQELEDHPERPPHFPWIWDWFFDFPSPITWPDIRAWSDGYTHVERFEGELLIRLDNLRNK